MGRRAYEIRFFRCPGCANIFSASKLEHQTTNGHIKTIWCPFCKKDMDMTQVDREPLRK